MLKQNSFSDKLFHSGVKEQNGENSGQAACHPSVFVSQAEECWHEYLPNSVSPSRVSEFNMICFSPFDLKNTCRMRNLNIPQMCTVELAQYFTVIIEAFFVSQINFSSDCLP